MEEYFNKLMAKAEAIQATKDDDLTAADREAIEYRKGESNSIFAGIAGTGPFAAKDYQEYQDVYYQEVKKAHLRQKAAQEIANFYHHPELNGDHEIIEDTLAYLNEITKNDFEHYIDLLKSEYGEAKTAVSIGQHFWALLQYGHTVPAARHFLNDAIDLMTLAIHKLGIDGKKAIEEEILDIAYKWRDSWKEAGIDDTATLKKLREEIDRNDAINWANERFSAPDANPDDDPDYEPKFSDAFFYQDAERHAQLFDRNRFKNRLKELNKKDCGAIEKTEIIQLLDYYRTLGFAEYARDLGEPHEPAKPQIRHYEDSKESAIQFIKDYWLEDHYKACRILGKDTKELDEIAEKRAAVFYDPITLPDIRTHFPERFRKPKDKLSRTVFDGKDRLFDEQFKALGMESKNASKTITTYAKIGFDEDFNDVSMPKLSPYENIVHDAIGSLYYEGGNEYMTPGMINKAITGDPKARLTPSKRQDIMNAVSKLMHSSISIKSKDEDYTYIGHIMDARMITKMMTVQGKREPQDAIIQILGGMPLYQYAGQKKQIITGPMEYLNPPLNMTKETILLTDFLLKRISWKEIKIIILYSTLYEQLGIDENDRKSKNQRAKIRQEALTILNYWKDKTAPIFGGRVIKEIHEQNDKGQPLKKRQRAHRLVILKA